MNERPPLEKPGSEKLDEIIQKLMTSGAAISQPEIGATLDETASNPDWDSHAAQVIEILKKADKEAAQTGSAQLVTFVSRQGKPPFLVHTAALANENPHSSGNVGVKLQQTFSTYQGQYRPKHVVWLKLDEGGTVREILTQKDIGLKEDSFHFSGKYKT